MKKSTTQLMEILSSKKDYSEFLSEEIGEMIFSTTSEYLDLLLNQKKLKKSQVIRNGNLNRDYAYQLFNGTKKNPSRDKILMMAFGMQLNIEETRKLLKICELPDLYPRNPRDAAIIFCISKGRSILDVNELLVDLDLAILE